MRSIPLDLLLTLLTCFLYNVYIQYKQMQAVNDMLKENKYNFVHWLLFCIFTCFLYHIYHEYRMSSDIARVRGKDENGAGLVGVLLALFGLTFINDAIQQAEINAHYGNTQL